MPGSRHHAAKSTRGQRVAGQWVDGSMGQMGRRLTFTFTMLYMNSRRRQAHAIPLQKTHSVWWHQAHATLLQKAHSVFCLLDG